MAVDDEPAVAAVLAEFLATVSFEEGRRPDYSALPGLFTDGARLVRTSIVPPESWTVEHFVVSRRQQVESGRLTAFHEREFAHVTEVFGNTAHRFSAYSKRSVLDGVRTEVDGMISCQFVRVPDGWRISSMAWDDERPGLTIRDRYRSRGWSTRRT